MGAVLAFCLPRLGKRRAHRFAIESIELKTAPRSWGGGHARAEELRIRGQRWSRSKRPRLPEAITRDSKRPPQEEELLSQLDPPPAA